jgi:hypothetical protein
MGWVRIELTTNALKGRCSTFELPSRISKSITNYNKIKYFFSLNSEIVKSEIDK